MLGELHVNWGTHRMKPTISKPIVQPSSKTASSHPKSPPKLNNIDVNTFKELSVISCFTSGSSKSDNNMINNHHSSVQRSINSQAPLNSVPVKSENATSDLIMADDHLKQKNDYYSSDAVQETINSETPLNIVPQHEMVSIDTDQPILQDTNHQSIIDHSQSEIVRPDLLKTVDDLKLSDHRSSCVIQESLNSERTLNLASRCEIASPDLPKVDHCLKPVNDHNSSLVVQETMNLKTSSNVNPKSKIDILSSKIDINSNNCPPKLKNGRENNFTPKDSDCLTKEMNKETDQTKICTKNLAYTIEFEPDNRFLVYEHHKVGLEKSPLISKKRVSKNYESIKPFTNSNKKSDLEDVEIQSNFAPDPKEAFENKNVLLINEVESSAPSNITRNHEVNTTQTDNEVAISNPSNKVSLSWRERVLEIMEVSENSSNKNLSFPNTNSNQLESGPASKTKSVESQSEAVHVTNKSDTNNKYTDIDKSLLIDQELIDILNPKKKTLENFTDDLLHYGDAVHEINLQKQVQLDSEVTASIDEKNNQNIQNVENSNDMGTLQNEFLDADLYFSEENNHEIVKMENDDSMDVDMYFVEENNIADEVLREETSNIENILKHEHSAKECNLIADFDIKHDVNVLETNNCADSIEVCLDIRGFNDNSPHPNDEYQTHKNLEAANINRVNVDSLDNEEIALDVSPASECEINDLVDIDDDVHQYLSETFEQQNDILENVVGSASPINTPKIEEGIEYRSVSDSELQKKLIKEDEISKMVKRDLGTTFENKDALNFKKSESGDYPTLVKDKILRLAGQEFVLMANRNKECDTFERFQKDHNCDIDSEVNNIYLPISQDNNLYHGSYKPNTYCLNTHTNSYKDSADTYSDIFSHLKRSNEDEPKITSWQTMPHRSECCTDCESISEKDSLDIKFVEDSADEFYIFQPNPSYNNRGDPFETESFNHPLKKNSSEGVRYSFSSSSSSYNNGEDQHSFNENSFIGQESLSDDSPPSFISSKERSYKSHTSSHIPLLKSKRNDAYKSNTLPPLFTEPKVTVKCDKQTKTKKFDFSKCNKHLKNDYYTHYSNIENFSEESDSDWDLSDYDTYERKKTVFTRSSKTVYNKYYEQVEYSQESNEFQTIKTSMSNLPLPHADFFKENEFKLPKIQSKHVPINQRVERKKMMDFEKLPLLRNPEDWKWFV